MQTSMAIDMQARHMEQRQWSDIREYAAEKLRRKEEEKTKSRTVGSKNDGTSLTINEIDMEGLCEVDLFPRDPDSFFGKSNDRDGIDIEDISNTTAQPQQNVSNDVVHEPVVGMNTRMNSSIDTRMDTLMDTAMDTTMDACIAGNVCERREEISVEAANGVMAPSGVAQITQMTDGTTDMILDDPLQTYNVNSAFEDDIGMSQLTSALPSFACELPSFSTTSVELPETNGRTTTQHIGENVPFVANSCDSSSIGTQTSNTGIQAQKDTSSLTSDGSECDILVQVLENLNLGDSKDNSKKSKKTKSTLGSVKKAAKKSANVKDGVCKKGKPRKKVGLLKKKDFVCLYDGCGKAFERRYNLKVHTRRHTGEMPYICPKTDEGCFLYFRWRSSLRHHLKTVHNDVVPIAQSNAARLRTQVAPIAQAMVGTTTTRAATSSSTCTGPRSSSSAKSGGTRRKASTDKGVKKPNSRRKKQARKNFPAVAVRQPTAEELARVQQKAAMNAQFVATEPPISNVEDHNMGPRHGITLATEAGAVQSSYAPSGQSGHNVIDISTFLYTNEEASEVVCDGSYNNDKDVFDAMEFDIPSEFTLPTLMDSNQSEDLLVGM